MLFSLQHLDQYQEPYQDEDDHPSQSEESEDYCEHEGSQRAVSPSQNCPKPPIYKQSRRISAEKTSSKYRSQYEESENDVLER